VVNPATLNGNGLATLTTTFDAKLNTLDNWMNNLTLSKTVDVGGGSISAQGGYYHSHQEIGIASSWASYVQGVAGNGQSTYLDVYDPAGNKLTQGGQWAYGTPTFGNCCTQDGEVRANINAFYGSVVADFNPLNVDLSLRRDDGRVEGTYRGSTVVRNLDVDGDGVIQPIERQVPAFNATTRPVDYDYGYWSYSAGLNYLVTPDIAVFARYSKGARANTDRLIIGRIRPDGSASRDDIVAPVKQAEAGVKYRGGAFGLFATAFYARTLEVTGDDRTRPNFTTNRTYEA
jgi:outer membrane receptor protein involved in Fe transport